MKTKTKFRILASLIVFTVCSAAALVAGCSVGGDTLDKYLDRNGASDCCVTYYGNGGTFNGNETKTVTDVYYKPDSYIISESTDNFYVERSYFNFDAWYYGEADSQGNPVLDADGNLKLTERKLGAKEIIAFGEHLYVGAKWNSNVALEVYLVTDGFTVKSGDTVYKSGDLIKTSNFGSATVYGLSERRDAITADDATFLSFYEDEGCTKPIVTVTKPDDVNAENVKIYAKYIEGKWTVVKSVTDVSNMFNRSSNGGNYYLFSTDGSNLINCADTTFVLNQYTFNINIVGNGVTLQNLRFRSIGIGSASFSIFGKLAAEAKISDLTLKDVEISVTARSNLSLYLVHHGDDGAEINGLKIENVNYTISSPESVLIENMQNDNTDNWLFGGVATDDEYLENTSGITVVNASLTLNGNTLVENISKNGGITQ